MKDSGEFEIRFKVNHKNPSYGNMLLFWILKRKHDRLGIWRLDIRRNPKELKTVIKEEHLILLWLTWIISKVLKGAKMMHQLTRYCTSQALGYYVFPIQVLKNILKKEERKKERNNLLTDYTTGLRET